MSKAFPIANILMALGASLMYGLSGNLRQTVYWAAVAIITVTVTF